MTGPVVLTLVLRQPAAARDISAQLLAGTYHASKTKPADLAANPEDVAAVEQFAATHNLKVIKSDPAARTIRVSGSIPDVEKAFGLPQGSAESLNYKGPFHLPAPLDKIVMAVLGLDHSPVARPGV